MSQSETSSMLRKVLSEADYATETTFVTKCVRKFLRDVAHPAPISYKSLNKDDCTKEALKHNTFRVF